MTFPRAVLAHLTGWLIVQPLYNRLLNAYRRRELERPGSATHAFYREQARAIIDEFYRYVPAGRPPVALEVIDAQHAEIRRLRDEIAALEIAAVKPSAWRDYGPLGTSHPGWERGPSGQAATSLRRASMAEGKYGRLFAEADVRAMLVQAACWSMDDSTITAGEIADRTIDSFPVTFPPDEPLFLLRGQDKAAPSAIQENPSPGRDYWMAAMRVGASDEHLKAVAAAAREMREWQAANPDRVKIPD